MSMVTLAKPARRANATAARVAAEGALRVEVEVLDREREAVHAEGGERGELVGGGVARIAGTRSVEAQNEVGEVREVREVGEVEAQNEVAEVGVRSVRSRRKMRSVMSV